MNFKKTVMFMKNKVLFIFTLASLVFMFIGLVDTIAAKGMASADAAGWAQAIGTFGAFVGAIWIANNQERLRRSDALAVAKMMAATMTYRLVALHNDLVDAYTWFDKFSKEDGTAKGFQYKAEFLQNQPHWSAEELKKLVPLPGDSAYKIAAALDRIGSAVSLIRRDVANPYFNSLSEYRKSRAVFVRMILEKAISNLKSAIEQMRDHIDGVEDIENSISDKIDTSSKVS